jgi:hypothetical protein
MSDEQKVSIATLSGGAAVEMFDEALQKCWENIQDPNTPAVKKREVALKVTLSPSEERDFVACEITCTPKLSACKGVMGRVSVGSDGKSVVATEWVSPQTDLEDYIATDNVRSLRGEK